MDEIDLDLDAELGENPIARSDSMSQKRKKKKTLSNLSKPDILLKLINSVAQKKIEKIKTLKTAEVKKLIDWSQIYLPSSLFDSSGDVIIDQNSTQKLEKFEANKSEFMKTNFPIKFICKATQRPLMKTRDYGKLIARSSGFEHSEANLRNYFVQKAHNRHLYVDNRDNKDLKF